MAQSKEKTSYVPKIFSPRNLSTSVFPFSQGAAAGAKCWKWGDDNLLPEALALMARNSTVHRRIINDKADYISGKGFIFDESQAILASFVEHANYRGESLREVLHKVAMDKTLFGNAFIEIVTDEAKSFLAVFHQDASLCRLSVDDTHVVLHHNWGAYSDKDARRLSLYPAFGQGADGCLHSVIHYKDYEPTFSHYGIPGYIAGMNVSAIAYKTDKWNISRLDNSFQLSGVMLLDGGVDNEEQAETLVKTAERKFAGKPGQVMFMIKDCGEGDSSRYIPITTSSDGDWKTLHDQATSDIVIAHSWFRTLSGLDYGSGFSAERILHEYEVALNTLILGQQSEILEPLLKVIESILGVDCQSLKIINHPPARVKPAYMRIWEARKADGLEYDSSDPQQCRFLAELGD